MSNIWITTIVDFISQTPTGTFFGVIGISVGFHDPNVAQYIDFILHLLTGLTAGNIFGQYLYLERLITL